MESLSLQINLEKNIEFTKIGLHTIVEYEGCDLSKLCIEEGFTEALMQTWVEILDEIGVQTLGKHAHYFGPNSITLSLNLSESHLNFHTWPEYDYVAMDFFCCKKDDNLKIEMESVIERGAQLFKSKTIKNIWVNRGFKVSF